MYSNKYHPIRLVAMMRYCFLPGADCFYLKLLFLQIRTKYILYAMLLNANEKQD